MASVTKTVDLALPQAEAFELATDPARFNEWLTMHKGWPGGPPSTTDAGAEFSQKLELMGMPADVAWTVEEHDAPNRLRLRGAGPMGATLATTISTAPGDDGTTISYEAEFSGGAIEGPMGDLVAQNAGQAIEVSLTKLQALAAA